MKKMLSWILVLAVFLQLLTPIVVQADLEQYFIINTVEAAPGELIKIKYYFRAINGENYTLYLKNTNGMVYQTWNLTCQPNSPYIKGYHEFTAPLDEGQYEFQLYGRVTRELRDEILGSGIFSNIVISVGEFNDNVLEYLTASEFPGLIYAVMNVFTNEIMSGSGTGENNAEPIMLFNSPPIEVKKYPAKVWANISPWPGGKIHGNYENIPQTGNPYIGMYRVSRGLELRYGEVYIENTVEGVAEFEMPVAPGVWNFETRYSSNTNGHWDEVTTGVSSPIYVIPHNTVFKNIPDKINKGGQLNIQIENAPYGERTWAGIYPLDSREYDNYWGNLVSLSNSNSGVINSTAPVNPGLYCVRVFSQGSNTIYISTSSPFEVVNMPEVDSDVTTGHFGGQLSPLILQAEAGNNYVMLSWARVTDSRGVLGYNIYRSTSPGGQTEVPLNASLVNGTIYTDMNVNVDTTYYYTVRPVYGDNSLGAMSNEVSVAPKKWAGTMDTSVGTVPDPAVGMQPVGTTPGTTDGTTGGTTDGTTDGTTTGTGTSGQQQGDGRWNGVWKIDSGMMMLSQTGNNVTGTYGEWEDNLVINGTANGNRLTGTMDTGFGPGRFEFTIAQDERISGWSRPDGYEDWEESFQGVGVKLSDSFGNTGNAWGGVWYTDFGPMVLTQNGSGITGVYRPYCDVPVFQIEGTASGNAFTGRIREGEFTGEFRFNLESGGRSFSGQYRYTGEDEWTDWNGIRKR